MADDPKKDFFWLAKKVGSQLLIVMVIGGMLVVGGGLFAGAYAFKVENTQPQGDMTKMYPPGNASDECLLQGLRKAHPTDADAAWANLTGGAGSDHPGVNALPYFKDAAAKYKVPLALAIAVGKIEHGFQHTGNSDAGAVGMMQIMPDTFPEARQNAGLDKDAQITDLKTNVYAGVAYLAKRYERWNNNYQLAAAAYNAGDGNVINAGNKVPNFAETKNYVQNVTAIYTAITACSEPKAGGGAAGTHSQKIAAETIKHVGEAACLYYKPDPSNACAAFVSAIINPIAKTSLGLIVPDNWGSKDGTRLIIDSNFVVKGSSDQTITLSDIKPGDYVFFADQGSSYGYNNPRHSGIYVGDYTDPKTGKVTPRAVVNTTQAEGYPIQAISIENFDPKKHTPIGIKRF